MLASSESNEESKTLFEEVQMSYVKPAIVVFAALAMSAPSFVHAQGFTQRGTRGGAIAGAIIGGLIGAGNDEALAGAAIGGVVGGVAGRAIGRSRDVQYRGGGYGRGYYQQPSYYRGGHSRNYGVRYVPAQPVYRANYYGGNYYRGGGGFYRSSCPNAGW